MDSATLPGKNTFVTPRGRTQRVPLSVDEVSEFATAQPILAQRMLPLVGLLVMESFVAVGVSLSLLIGLAGWYGCAIGLGVASIFVLPVRGATITSRLTGRLGFWWERRRRRVTTERPAPFDVQLAALPPVGFHWDGKVLTSLVRVRHNPLALTVLDTVGTVSGDTVSLKMLAECLQQFDITLDSIDVITQGSRSHGQGQIAATYDAVLGPLPAIATRSVWVAVRLDPTRCLGAVSRRGGGWDGITRTAVVATRRVANRLSDMGLQPEIMTARGIDRAEDELSDGVDRATADETWVACRQGRFQLRTFVLNPAMFTNEGFSRLWMMPSYSTTLCVSLRRDVVSGLIKLRGLARFTSRGSPRIALQGLGELRGRQYAGLVGSLPAPAPRRSVRQWVIGKHVDALDNLELPAQGCGQLIGADEHGRAVAVSLFGPGVGRVEMCGTLRLAQQVVLRSLALGARVRVHTARVAAWQAMVGQVGDEGYLHIADHGRGTLPDCSVELFDGVTGLSANPDVTTMVVHPPQTPPSRSADVTLMLIDRDHDVVRVDTSEGSAVVTMVATNDEMRYL